jgi:hypothetical protein
LYLAGRSSRPSPGSQTHIWEPLFVVGLNSARLHECILERTPTSPSAPLDLRLKIPVNMASTLVYGRDRSCPSVQAGGREIELQHWLDSTMCLFAARLARRVPEPEYHVILAEHVRNCSGAVSTTHCLCPEGGHEEACQPSHRYDRSFSTTGHNHCSAVDFSVVHTRRHLCSMRSTSLKRSLHRV